MTGVTVLERPRLADERAAIAFDRLRDLWFHMGTACNLRCPSCLEGSKPGDTRLGPMRRAEVEPYVREALDLGVERFAFTGGEPFVAREFPAILELAAQARPCLVLTNGTRPLQRRLHELAPLVARPYHPIAFRVSLDAPDAARHDAGRGAGRFEEALAGLRALHELGFGVSVARQRGAGECGDAVEDEFRVLFHRGGLPADLSIVAFPDFHRPAAEVPVEVITAQCLASAAGTGSQGWFMCATSRMVVKRGGLPRVYACTLVDDDPGFELGASLRASLQRRVVLRHHRCYSCFKLGADCGPP